MDLWIISCMGRDRPGLIRDILDLPAKMNVNVVDLDQRVLQGLFIMSLVADFALAHVTPVELERLMQPLAKAGGLHLSFLPLDQYRGRRKLNKDLYVVTILARDRVGIIRDVASLAAENDVNIEQARVTARGELISIEFIMDFSDCDVRACREIMRREAEILGLDMVIQPLDKSRKEKRLIVFDMDMTIVDFEIINRLASFVGMDEEVRSITDMAMNGDIDFEESLRRRVRLLKGMTVNDLKSIADDLQLTPGSEELIHHLKQMGYKIALISGGFTYFTDILKSRLGFDYAFANELDIVDGTLTGGIKGNIIDAKAKGDIVNYLAEIEGISPDNIVAVGDGANDCLMIQNAGLGVAFNAKDILKKVSDGTISRDNLLGLLNVLGIVKKDGEML